MINVTYPPGLTTLQVPGLTQYDTGQQIQFEGTGITTETVQAHFAASGQSSAIVKTGTVDDGVITAEIPDSVLASGRTVTAWVYVIDGTAQETKYTAVLPVVSRVRPQDYISPAEPPYLTANELDARVQANTDAIGALDGRVDGAEAEIADRYTKTEADALLAEKANKQQEDWITPTLLAPYIGPYVNYMKDSFGFVHMRGRVSSGDGSQLILFNLPEGYRPLGMLDFRVHSNNPSGGSIRIIGTGEVRNQQGHTFINLDGITFRAEA